MSNVDYEIADHDFSTTAPQHFADSVPTERGTEASDTEAAHQAAWTKTASGYFADSL